MGVGVGSSESIFQPYYLMTISSRASFCSCLVRKWYQDHRFAELNEELDLRAFSVEPSHEVQELTPEDIDLLLGLLLPLSQGLLSISSILLAP